MHGLLKLSKNLSLQQLDGAVAINVSPTLHQSVLLLLLSCGLLLLALPKLLDLNFLIVFVVVQLNTELVEELLQFIFLD